MIRSSFLSRIKEIGIYRAIGVKRVDIYKMFYGEIFAITTQEYDYDNLDIDTLTASYKSAKDSIIMELIKEGKNGASE